MNTDVWWKHPKKIDYLEDPKVNVRIILQSVLNK